MRMFANLLFVLFFCVLLVFLSAGGAAEKKVPEEDLFVEIVRTAYYGNEPFPILCLVTRDGDLYVVHREDKEKAEKMGSSWYEVSLFFDSESPAPPGISCKGVVRLISFNKE